MIIPAVVEDWFTVHDAYHKASDTYNKRLKFVRSERDKGNWNTHVEAEYRALHDAQSAAFEASESLYWYLRARRDLAAHTAGKGET